MKWSYSSLLFLLLFGGFYLTTRNAPIIKMTIWDRFEWDSEAGSFKGDNRISKTSNEFYNQIKGTQEYWWGLQDNKRELFISMSEGSSSYKNIVAMNGMFFFALYTFFFILLGWYYQKKWSDFIVYLALVLICFYQRTIRRRKNSSICRN